MKKVILLELTEKRLVSVSKMLREKYGFDSLDKVELLMEMEKLFEVYIPFVGDMEWEY